MATLSNVFSDVYISGNCTVKGTITTLGSGTQWTTVGSGIYYNSGNVGIGLTSPNSILNVNVTGSVANLYSTTTGTNASMFFVNTADSRRAFVGMDGTGLFALSTGALALGTDNTPVIIAPSYSTGEKVRVTTTGLVGIGTTNPGSLLTVSGGVGIGTGYTAFTAPTSGLIVQGSVGIGTSNPGTNALQVSGNIATSGFTSNATNTVFNFDTLTVPFVSATQVLASTNVGIGTTNPQALLNIFNTTSGTSAATLMNIQYGTNQDSFQVAYDTTLGTSGGMRMMNIYGQTAAELAAIKIYSITTTTGAIGFFTNNGSGQTERMRIIANGNVGIGSTGPGYALDVVNDVNCSGSFRVNTILQPKIPALTTFTAVTSFDAGNFDLVNFNNVEIRVIPYFNTSNFQNVTIQALDTNGTVYNPNEYSWQGWRGTASATYASSASAVVIPITELATNGVGPSICVVRITGLNGLTGAQRFHVEWDSTGCYAGVGATQVIGRCYFGTTNIQINRIRFNLSGGTMTGKYSMVHYV